MTGIKINEKVDYSVKDLLLKSKFDSIYRIMEDSFPSSEMRTYDGQKSLLNNDFYHINVQTDDKDAVMGFLAYWDLSNCVFIEHLAVDENSRGKGIGGKLVDQIFKESKKAIFFEVEPPVDEISRRRVKFYEKKGAHLNGFYYEQPALRENEKAQHLMIMSYPNPIDGDSFNKYKEEIYKHVYNVIQE